MSLSNKMKLINSCVRHAVNNAWRTGQSYRCSILFKKFNIIFNSQQVGTTEYSGASFGQCWNFITFWLLVYKLLTNLTYRIVPCLINWGIEKLLLDDSRHPKDVSLSIKDEELLGQQFNGEYVWMILDKSALQENFSSTRCSSSQ